VVAVFFFSSRRRHTRSKRDWSSDVCSSDLSRTHAHHYDVKYRDANYFRYRRGLYAPYVSTLVRACGLPAGSSVLDVGCGQGFFSYLFHAHGMRVTGVDVSETGIQTAERLYGRRGITFAVADVRTAR